MKVKRGWSGESTGGQWSKFDVEVDETDLQRIIHSAPEGYFPDWNKIPVSVVFQLLELETDVLMHAALAARFAMAPEQAQAAIQQGREKQVDILEKLRSSD
jgi:hypothetical protein